MRMLSPRVKKEDVAAAAEILLKEGKKVTTPAIHDFLGRGSYGTIHKFRNELNLDCRSMKDKQPDIVYRDKSLSLTSVIASFEKQVKELKEEIEALKKIVAPFLSTAPREGVNGEGIKVNESVNKEVAKSVNKSGQTSLFEKPITNKIEVIATEDTVKEGVKDTVKELLKSKDSEIQQYNAQKDLTIATKDKEIQILNEKVQTLELAMTKRDGEFRKIFDTISDFKNRARDTRNWTEFNRFLNAIGALQLSVNFT